MTELDMIVEGLQESISNARKNLEFWSDFNDSEYWNGIIDGLVQAKDIVRAKQFEIMKSGSNAF